MADAADSRVGRDLIGQPTSAKMTGDAGVVMGDGRRLNLPGSVPACIGRTAATDSGIRSIRDFVMPASHHAVPSGMHLDPSPAACP
ncbi:hypothetical protein [Burkholderia lata]|uniref:hypothetical protein n=1 Tax=Burkholderia lata (strain ATCC 17760 / DSM 23089 / LMG 22485 / NCIMB 9086 / R18194 / 383) TaxID=482957 RepID=UPI0015818E64|nr:hypothetical protein [Burkholderia lata]